MMVLLSVAVLAVSVGLASSLAAPPAQAATPTQLTNLQFSWMGGLLQKTQVKYVTVRLTLVDPDGVSGPLGIPTWPGQMNCPCVYVSHVVVGEPRSRIQRIVQLHLTSGTNKNGVWSGRFALGAADSGFWRATAMAAGDIVTPATPNGFDQLAPVPAPWNQVTVNVRGYNWPRAWLGSPVASAGKYTIRGGVALSRSGAPIGGLRLEVHSYCSPPNLVFVDWELLRVVVTNASGRFAYTVAPGNFHPKVCAAAVVYPNDTPDNFVVQTNIRNWG
jgi:hypothetical protein